MAILSVQVSRFLIIISFPLFAQAQSNAAGPKGAAPPGGPPPEETQSPGDADSAKSCRERILRMYPSASDRYTESFLDTFCGRYASWQRTLANNSEGHSSRRANFTDSQLSWLRSLHKCQDADCICEQSDACATHNSSTAAGARTRSKRQQFRVDNSLPNRAGRAVRREIRQMSDGDRHRYFRALNNLKNDFIDGMSKYDIMVLYHTPEYAPEGHFREMLKNMELALRMIDPGVSLPYWDSTMDAALPNPADSILWTSDFFGNGFGDVRSGPFGNWFVVSDDEVGTLSRSGRLMRSLGRQGSLLDEGDVGTIMRKPRFRNLVFCVDPFFELAHGGTHMWVGGHMGPLRTSPNDPVFYSLHAFIDLLWENWRWDHQGYEQRANEYWGCNRVSRPNAQMQPYSLTNADGLSNRYTEVFYSYSQRPMCPGCGGAEYLFCDTRWNKCMSKIRPGGLCRGFEGFDACVNGQCVNGRCAGGNGNNNNNDNNNNGGSCQNDHACCNQWAKMDECSKNQDWMRSNCRAACGICRDGNSQSGCTDTDERCAEWASEGECQSNSVWMAIGCPVSCSTCESRAAAELCTTSSGGSPGNRCRNTDRRCAQWARNGECNSNSDWMRTSCALACHSC